MRPILKLYEPPCDDDDDDDGEDDRFTYSSRPFVSGVLWGLASVALGLSAAALLWIVSAGTR